MPLPHGLITLRIKVGTALAAADRQSGQRDFESLLKTKKLQNALIN